MGIIWSELFPSKLSIFIFIFYMSLFVSQGIIVTASQESNNSYSYNTVLVVLLTEVFKLILSVCLYCKDNSIKSLFVNIFKDVNVLCLYFVPAFLYCLYNNLAFVNLSTFDPTTYYLLLQLRVVITGVLFQMIFKKYLTKRQWISLILLTAGCMIKQINFNQVSSTTTSDITSNKSLNTNFSNSLPHQEHTNNGIMSKNMKGFDFNLSAILILIQTICSCLAGVYNEYLLKNKGSNVNIFIQNVYMYIDSIICNILILILQGNVIDAFSISNFQSILRFNVIIIIINNAAIGIVTSFFLKYMNSILKTFASALELVFTAILSYILFSIPIYLNTVLAIFVVSFAIYLYSQSPVVNLGKIKNSSSIQYGEDFRNNERNDSDCRKLLDNNYDQENLV